MTRFPDPHAREAEALGHPPRVAAPDFPLPGAALPEAPPQRAPRVGSTRPARAARDGRTSPRCAPPTIAPAPTARPTAGREDTPADGTRGEAAPEACHRGRRAPTRRAWAPATSPRRRRPSRAPRAKSRSPRVRAGRPRGNPRCRRAGGEPNTRPDTRTATRDLRCRGGGPRRRSGRALGDPGPASITRGTSATNLRVSPRAQTCPVERARSLSRLRRRETPVWCTSSFQSPPSPRPRDGANAVDTGYFRLPGT